MLLFATWLVLSHVHVAVAVHAASPRARICIFEFCSAILVSTQRDFLCVVRIISYSWVRGLFVRHGVAAWCNLAGLAILRRGTARVGLYAHWSPVLRELSQRVPVLFSTSSCLSINTRHFLCDLSWDDFAGWKNPVSFTFTACVVKFPTFLPSPASLNFIGLACAHLVFLILLEFPGSFTMWHWPLIGTERRRHIGSWEWRPGLALGRRAFLLHLFDSAGPLLPILLWFFYSMWWIYSAGIDVEVS